jgi:eukaryotic-like serine/threonine-protein kinase
METTRREVACFARAPLIGVTAPLDEARIGAELPRALCDVDASGGRAVLVSRPMSARPDVLQETLARLPSGLTTIETIRPDSIALDATVPGTGAQSGAFPRLPPLSLREPSGDETGEEADLEIVRTLGEGGMGRVVLASQRSLGREVAVKMLRHDADERAARALLLEAVITGRIEHPNVIPIHQLGVDARRRPVITMKRVAGVSWAELLRDPSHPLWERVGSTSTDRLSVNVEILMHVAAALEHAHGLGFAHRDVKPANVMLGEQGEVYLVDWGIAIPTGAEGGGEDAFAGTPAYLAPEMVSGRYEDVTPATDVYLLGATLHEVLTGAPPHTGETVLAAVASALLAEPPIYGPEVPKELASIAARAMALAPADRFGSAWELRQALATYLRHRVSNTMADASEERLRALELALTSGDPSDASRIHALGSECRFGFRQALAEWSENIRARAGLTRTIELLVEHEMTRRNAPAARDLLSELSGLSEERDELRVRLAALETELEDEHARAEAQRRHEREHDLSIGGRARLGALVVFGVAASCITAYFAFRPVPDPSPMERLAVMTFMAVSTAVVVLLGRRWLLATRIARVTVAVLAIHLAGAWSLRAIGVVLDMGSAEVFGAEFVLMAAVSAILGATTLRWGWVVSGIALAGAAMMAVAPAQAVLVYSVAGTLVLFVLLAAFARPRRPPSSG